MSYTGSKLNIDILITKLYTVHYFEYSKDYKFIGEAHDFWELVYVDKGDITAIAGDDEIALRQGDIIFHKPNGEYVSGELPIIVDGETGKLLDGTIAGSIAPLSKCVRKAIEFGIPEEDAFRMASEIPARLLGVTKGKLEEGYDADFIVVDNNCNVITTVIGGKVWQN